MPIVILRAFSVYGPNENSFGTSPSVTGMFKKLHSLKRSVHVDGDGSNVRDFIHVDDLAAGILLAAQNPEADNNVLNLGSGQGFTIQTVAEMTAQKVVYRPARNHDLKLSIAKTDRMKTLLGLSLSHKFRESFLEILEESSESIQPDSYKWIKNFDTNLAPWILGSR